MIRSSQTIDHRNIGLITILIILYTTIIQSQNIADENSCITKVTCQECLQTKDCGWCMRKDLNVQPRCFHSAFASGICAEESTYMPNNEEIHILSRELTLNSVDYDASPAHNEYVEIIPQRVGLKLRIGEEHRLLFRYAKTRPYPIDLYYLIDLSKSMDEEKENLLKLGDELVAIKKKITSNFRIGFGSFVTKGSNLSAIAEVKNSSDQCEAAYTFKNHMPLIKNTNQFTNGLKNAVISGNLDTQEISSHAMMQAIVCGDRIGWRANAKHILIFSSNAHFRLADQEKVDDGITIIPNDGKCHLDSDGSYIQSTNQNYPSISQINEKVRENYVNIIFTVPDRQKDFYRKLSNYIEGSSSASLSNYLSNVVELINEQYNRITSSVEMKDNATGPVKIAYYSACLTGGKPIQTNKCDNLNIGQVVNFEARIVVTSCPANPNDWYQTFQIYPVGDDNSLIIDLEMLCQCPCEVDGPLYEEKSLKCNGHGTYKCGICNCDLDYYGRNCECYAIGINNHIKIDNGCRRQNNTEIDCSGRGSCICNICECEKRVLPDEIIFGKFCECDNFSCDRHNGLLCSGPDHGTCDCGQCVCKPGWTGSACDCLSSNDTCIKPGSEELCSGRGECICGTCECKLSVDGASFSGQYCESIA